MNRLASFGIVRGVDEKRHQATVVASTEEIARDGFQILASGWRLDEYERTGAPVLWAHDDSQPPIARATRTWVQDRKLYQTHQFDPHDTRSMEFFGKIQRRMLTSVSVRWFPVRHEFRKVNGKETLVFTEQNLAEVSWVSVPADTHANVLRDAETDRVLTRSAFATIANGKGTRPALSSALDTVRSPFERAWVQPTASKAERDEIMAANLELMGIVIGARASTSPAHNGLTWEEGDASEAFMRAWREHVFAGGGPVVDLGGRYRAMDTAESGFGQDLIGTSFESQLWDAARSNDDLLRRIERIPVRFGNGAIATSGSLPELQLVQEHTGPTDSAYGTTKWGTSVEEGDGSKFTVQNMFSKELDEDSIIGFVPSLRRAVMEAWRLYVGSAVYNGDGTATSTGNINSDDDTPPATSHFLAWDGIRHHWLVDEAAQGANAAGAISETLLDDAVAKLSGDVADSILDLSDTDWGANRENLLIVADQSTLRGIRKLDGFDKQTGLYDGIALAAPTYATKTEADGKLSATPASNTVGQVSVVNTRGWRLFQHGGIRFVARRVQGRDQVLLEMYSRLSLAKHGDYVAAGIRNITV